MCDTALRVKKELLEQGINATILDPIFVKPLDTEMLYKLLLTHNKVVTIEEHAITCGLGSIINNFLMSNGFNQVQVLNCGIPELFLSHGSNGELLSEIGLDSKQISKRIGECFTFNPQTVISC